MKRITEHPILGKIEKGRAVNFTFDGKKMTGFEGEPVAAALKANGVMIHRYTAK
ncbi:MAG: 2Fe-2S iron-sulfur cluster-binding protein, partial [Oscillospiraceae bacterium]|nr:2Fe-2S iron-sulfur cluster-binding protein [Oscillospiraceae bacterium]